MCACDISYLGILKKKTSCLYNPFYEGRIYERNMWTFLFMSVITYIKRTGGRGEKLKQKSCFIFVILRRVIIIPRIAFIIDQILFVVFGWSILWPFSGVQEFICLSYCVAFVTMKISYKSCWKYCFLGDSHCLKYSQYISQNFNKKTILFFLYT